MSDHYLTWPEFVMVGSTLALPALVATVVVTVWFFRRRLRPALSGPGTAAAALGAAMATDALSLLLWPLMGLLWNDAERLGINSPGLWLLVTLLHPPGIVAALIVLASGRLVARLARPPLASRETPPESHS